MGVKQFLGIKWIENRPQMLFYNNVKKEIEYEECEGTIDLQKNKREKV